MFNYIDDILKAPVTDAHDTIGLSRENRPIKAAVIGRGNMNISLIAGCHADEPVGPRLLRKLQTWLKGLDDHHKLIRDYKWWIVPHANPDGEQVNKKWYTDDDDIFDIVTYMRHSARELPGDDVEFSFPHTPGGEGQRPENTAISRFWLTAKSTFHLHASLHGMMVAGGPWFLIDEAWINRSHILQETCVTEVKKMGYRLHDIDRKGEKGFRRISKGFSTRPDSNSMKAFFLAENNPQMAEKFYPSSMEAIRNIGGDPLTIVSEMPLFILPDFADCMEWPNPQWQAWQTKLNNWKTDLLSGKKSGEEIDYEIKQEGILPMPGDDQMRLQWRFISAAVEQVEAE